MTIQSNFTIVQRPGDKLEIHGETNSEGVDVAEKMYVSVPVDTKGAVAVYDAQVGEVWSVNHPVDSEANQRLAGGQSVILAGVILRNDGEPPFLWAQSLPIEIPGESVKAA